MGAPAGLGLYEGSDSQLTACGGVSVLPMGHPFCFKGHGLVLSHVCPFCLDTLDTLPSGETVE